MSAVIPTLPLALGEAEELLCEVLGAESRPHAESGEGSVEIDSVLVIDGRRFAVEYKKRGNPVAVASAAEQIKAYVERSEDPAIPLIVVPYMSDEGAALCERLGVNWLDLSGNASIRAPGVRIRLEGKPNLYPVRGRPADLFAPKASRITRWLLMHPDRTWLQKEIAEATDMDPGYTSRIFQALVDEGLVDRDASSRVHVAHPATLLAAWRESNDFSKHEIHRGVVGARTGMERTERIHERLEQADMLHAFTGLAAAFAYLPEVEYRLSVVYLREQATRKLLEDLGFQPAVEGANAWLVEPKDAGVFHGGREPDGLPSVHPVQAYVDLSDQPERSQEASVSLFRWIRRDWGLG